MDIEKSSEFTNLNSIEDVDKASYIGKCVSFRGLVSAMGQRYPEYEKTVFECRGCYRLYKIEQKVTIGNNTVTKPVKCRECGGASFNIVNTESDYADVQVIEIADIDELKKEKSVTATLILKENLVDKVNWGDLVEIKGIIETNKDRGRYFHFVNVKFIDKLPKSEGNVVIESSDKILITMLSEEADIFDRLVESFAPSIEGVSEVKEAIILQLFSIETKDPSKIESESPPESYSEPINILLIGENELKSEMLKFTAKVSPTSIYISGNKPLSIKPKYKRRLGRDLLEAGVLILSDGSILCVDNINSIRSVKEDIKIAMESQIINISIKSNGDSVSRSMPTQTSVLASISPKRKLNQRTPVSDQINMKPDLFAEFDLVFVANTKEHFNNVNIENISSYEAESDENSEKIQLDESLIRRYISYANNVNPRLNDENVRNCLHSFFMDLRKDFGPYLINQRKFTSLIELAKASARIHLRDEIEIEDAETAIRVYKNSLKSRGIDLDIDQPNINMILSREEIIKNQKLIDHIVNDIIERKEEVSLNRLIEDMIQKSELTEKMIRILIAGKYL